MSDRHQYQEAFEAAATAGDAEANFELAQIQAVLRRRHANDSTAQQHLLEACRLRHPGAQKQVGFNQMFALKQHAWQPISGCTLWLSGAIGSRSYKKEAVRSRLVALKHAQTNHSLKTDGLRNKLGYRQYNGDPSSVYGVRIHYVSAGDCHIVVEQIPGKSLPSVTNVAERLATNILYRLLVQGIDLDPQKIKWFEVYPDSDYGRSLPKRVTFEWSEDVYSNPQWQDCSVRDVRVDLRDIVAGDKHHG
jgi:hypothetical protein